MSDVGRPAGRATWDWTTFRRGIAVRPRAAVAEPETVRLPRLGPDPFPHALSTGPPVLPVPPPERADLVRRARLGEPGAVYRLCVRAARPGRRIVRRYLGPSEREGTETLLFHACRRAVEALQRTAPEDRTFDFEREVRVGVRRAAAGRALRREVTGGGPGAEETLLAYDVLTSLPSHHADVLWAVCVEGEPPARHGPGPLRAGLDALVDAYLWRGLRRTGPVEARGSHLSYLTAASHVRLELTARRNDEVRAHLGGCALCRLLAAETAVPGSSLPARLRRRGAGPGPGGRGRDAPR
ncbi:hypothetical protein [Streptomyces tagetis]|uniref:Uncharacterized protein n=1 Tax=Streptomyces tagetis TaxID=2820809 RepID=A0A940XSL3_9ACTN|nr:hypothetical protein [Streptomyces sp. RG38]MBQ0830114.1 hypothetical protein [Streptomyces sp. RG38]